MVFSKLQVSLFSNMRLFHFSPSKSEPCSLSSIANCLCHFFSSCNCFLQLYTGPSYFFSSGLKKKIIQSVLPLESKNPKGMSKTSLQDMSSLQWKCFPNGDTDFTVLLLLVYILILNFIKWCTIKKLKTDFQLLVLNRKTYRSVTMYYKSRIWVNGL